MARFHTPDDDLGVVRRVYKKEATARIICIIVFLIVVSISWTFWLLHNLKVLVEIPPPDPEVIPNIVFRLLTFITLSSVIALALVNFLLAPRIILWKRKLVPSATSYTYLDKIVQDCSASVGLKNIPRVFIDEKPDGEVFILGSSSKRARIVMSKDLVNALSREEVQGIVFHELGHIKNGDMALMTWAVAFQRSLKYWLILYVFVSLTGLALLYRSLARALEILLLGTGESYSVLIPIIFYVFVTLAVNSASRVREVAADDLACDFVQPSTLISSIRSSALCALISNMLHGKTKRLHKIIRDVPCASEIKKLLGHHPTLRHRIANLKQKEFRGRFEKLSFPTLETAAYAGITASLVFIGTKGLIMRIPHWIFDPFAFFGIGASFLMWIPSWVVFIVLNNLFVWHYGSEKFFEKREGRTRRRNDIDRMMLGNTLTSCCFYFILSFFGIHDLVSLYFEPELILGAVLGDAIMTMIVGSLCFLVWNILLIILPKKVGLNSEMKGTFRRRGR